MATMAQTAAHKPIPKGTSKGVARVIPVPPIYRAMVLELERRRLAVGISMDQMSELMGTAERSYAKMLYPDTSSGRMAQWNTLQAALDVLFCDGYDLRINAMQPVLTTVGIPAPGVRTSEGTKRKIKAEAATWDRRIRREYMADLSKLAAIARIAKIPKWQRSQIARKAVMARWRKARQAEVHAA